MRGEITVLLLFACLYGSSAKRKQTNIPILVKTKAAVETRAQTTTVKVTDAPPTTVKVTDAPSTTVKVTVAPPTTTPKTTTKAVVQNVTSKIVTTSYLTRYWGSLWGYWHRRHWYPWGHWGRTWGRTWGWPWGHSWIYHRTPWYNHRYRGDEADLDQGEALDDQLSNADESKFKELFVLDGDTDNNDAACQLF
uniref:Uncharacterized protein n=1 Tax=Ciona savignyi TaxID=51511 RepID=H2Z3L6_CIOSA